MTGKPPSSSDHPVSTKLEVPEADRLRALLRAFVPGRLDEVAGIYGRPVADHLHATLGKHLMDASCMYDNSDVEKQAEFLRDALQFLPRGVRFPARAAGPIR